MPAVEGGAKSAECWAGWDAAMEAALAMGAMPSPTLEHANQRHRPANPTPTQQLRVAPRSPALIWSATRHCTRLMPGLDITTSTECMAPGMMLHGGIGSGMGAAGSVKIVPWRSGSGHSDVVQMHGAGHDDAWAGTM